MFTENRMWGRGLWAVATLLILAAWGPALAQTDVAEDAEVQVDMAFGTEVALETRSLIGSGTEFAADVDRVFCLTRIRGLAAPATVTHAWYHEGRNMARVELNVGSGDWRTWSSKRVLPAWTGAWEVKVLDETGKVLATADFTID